MAHTGALLFLASAHLLIFARSWFFGVDGTPSTYIPNDFDKSYFRVLVFISDTLRAGALPLWDPYIAGGLPNHINPQSLIWWPVSWVLSFIGPGYTHDAVQRQLLLTLLLGGFGAYALAFKLYKERTASVCGALCFSLSNGVYGNLEHLDIVNGYSHIPWLFLGVLSLGSPHQRTPVLLPVVIFSMIVSGYPAVTCMAFLWAITWHIRWTIKLRGGAARWFYGKRTLTSWTLGIGLASVHWLPILCHLREVDRGQAVSFERALWGSMHPDHLWSLIFNFMPAVDFPLSMVGAPPFFPAPSMRGIYVGIVTIPFVLLACRHLSGPIFAAACALALGGGLMALGEGFFVRLTLHTLIPFLNFSRFPAADSRALCVLGVAMLGAGGVREYIRNPDTGADFVRRICLFLILFLVFFLFVLKIIFSGRISDAFYREIVVYGICVQIGLLAVTALGARFLYPLLPSCMAIVLACDMGYAVSLNYEKLVGFDSTPAIAADRNKTEHGFPVAKALVGRHYLRIKLKNSDSFRGHTDKDFYLNYYGGLALKSFQDLMSRGFGDWLANGERVVGLDEGKYLDGIDDFLDSINPIDYEILSYLPDSVIYRVESSKDTVLVFNEIYFDGWQATLDGEERPMFPVSGGLRAMRIGAGRHEICTRFRPKVVYWGACLSSACFLCLSLLALRRTIKLLDRVDPLV